MPRKPPFIRRRRPTLIAMAAAVPIAFVLGGFFESVGLFGVANTLATINLATAAALDVDD